MFFRSSSKEDTTKVDDANVETKKESKPFQLTFLKQISKDSVGKNVTVSPLGIYTVLAITANGATRNTLAQMLSTLDEEDVESMNNTNKDIDKALSKLSSIELANAVFTAFEPEKEFLDAVRKLKTKVETLTGADQVNEWCSTATHEKIPKIIDTLNADDLMVLVNAIYFKGLWKKEFDANNTKKRKFKNLNKEEKETDFMNMTDKLDYFENEEVQAISLEYKKDNLKALVILPKKDADINTYISGLTTEKYDEIIKGLKNEKVILSLPKFECEFDADLKANLPDLGMVEPFTDQAEFAVMKKENDLSIKRVLHKAFIKVDEKGTEAGAATAVEMSRNILIDPNPLPEMIVDHPFLFTIRSDKLPEGHDMLFVGKVEQI